MKQKQKHTRASTVLDLGCGTGFLARQLADLVGEKGRVVGLDPNLNRLAIAKKKYSTSNLHFMQGSAESIPENTYDLILSNHVLHWCNNRTQAFANIAKSLKSRGKLACSYILAQHRDDDPLYLISAEHQQKIKAMMTAVREEECDVLIHQHNFRQLHKSKHECVHHFKTVQEYLEFFYIHWRIDERDVNMEAVLSKMEEEGGLYFRYPILTVVMEKP